MHARSLLTTVILVIAPFCKPVFANDQFNTWHEVLAKPHVSNFNAVAVGNGRLVAVGSGNTILTSDDAVVWVRSEIRSLNLSDVIWTGDFFLGIGGRRVATSADGLEWEIFEAPVVLTSVFFNGSAFLSFSGSGAVYSSFDGTTWVKEDSPLIRQPSDAVWIGDEWVVVGNDVLVGNAGEAWQIVTRNVRLGSVAWDGEKLVGGSRWGFLISYNVTDWQYVSADTSVYSNYMEFNGHYFVSGGGYDIDHGYFTKGNLAKSEDGVNWTFPPYLDFSIHDMVFFNDRWVAVGYNGMIASSKDLEEWRYASTSGNWFVQDIAWNGHQYLVVGGTLGIYLMGDSIFLSDDGLNWQEQPAADGVWYLEAVEWCTTQWLGIGTNLNSEYTVLASSDGSDWQFLHEAPAYGEVYCAPDKPALLLGGGYTTALVSASDDRQNWTEVIIPGSARLKAAVNNGERFVAVGWDGTIVWSDNGFDWFLAPKPTHDNLLGIAWGNGAFIAVGDNGTILRSPDGESWETIESISRIPLTSIVWTGDLFVASEARILTSPDGYDWEVLAGPPHYPVTSILWNDNSLFAVGGTNWISRRYFDAEGIPGNLGHKVVVPVVAQQQGQGDSIWKSDIHLLSRSKRWSEVWLGFGITDQEDLSWRRILLPPEGQLLRAEVLAQTFGVTERAGPLYIQADTPLVVESRSYTDEGVGTFGQSLPGIDENAHGSMILAHLTANSKFRTNVGMTNLGEEPLLLDFELWNADGVFLGATERYLGPYAWFQSGSILKSLAGGPVDDVYLIVTSPTAGAEFYAYASVVDNASNDPSFIQPTQASEATQIVTAATNSSGINGTRWTTEIEIVNPTAQHAEYTLEFLAGGGQESETFVLAPHSAKRFGNVVDEVFAQQGTGVLRVVPSQGEIVVTSRTSTTAQGGSFGQFIGAVPENETIWNGEDLFLLGLFQASDRTIGRRTNIGLVNPSQNEIEVVVELHHGSGDVVSVQTYTLSPESLTLLVEAFSHVAPINNGFAVLRSNSAVHTPLLAFASVIDNVSGDPIYVQAR